VPDRVRPHLRCDNSLALQAAGALGAPLPRVALWLTALGLALAACSNEDAQTPAPGPTGGTSAEGGGGGEGGEGGGSSAGASGQAGAGGIVGTAGAGGSGAAGEAGVAGAAGGGTVDDPCDTGSCLACTACLSEKTCSIEYKACFEDNPDCQALQQCYLGCDDATCRSACDAQAPEAAQEAARAFLVCSLCTACQTTCGPDPSCGSL
jgi:hypothetical protein